MVAGIVSGIATSAVSDSLREEFALQIQQSAELSVERADFWTGLENWPTGCSVSEAGTVPDQE